MEVRMNFSIFLYLLCALFSSISFGLTKTIITGKPVPLNSINGVYYLPGKYIPGRNGIFVRLEGDRYVCYFQAQTYLNGLNQRRISVNAFFTPLDWYCYQYNDDYFVIKSTKR